MILTKPIFKIISNELVPVKPLSAPSGIIYYMDFKYSDILKQRKKKIDKIFKKIKSKNEVLDN